jgi:DNA-binding NarL/FixJ family response regulator
MDNGSTMAMTSRATGWCDGEAAARASAERHGRRALSDLSRTALDRTTLLTVVTEVREALEEAAIAATAATTAAAAANRARSVAEALVVLHKADITAAHGHLAHYPVAPCVDTISPREWEVLALVAKGHTNKAIAAALYVSTNTVKTHVASLLHKLQVDSRVQLATFANTRSPHSASEPNGWGTHAPCSTNISHPDHSCDGRHQSRSQAVPIRASESGMSPPSINSKQGVPRCT